MAEIHSYMSLCSQAIPRREGAKEDVRRRHTERATRRRAALWLAVRRLAALKNERRLMAVPLPWSVMQGLDQHQIGLETWWRGWYPSGAPSVGLTSLDDLVRLFARRKKKRKGKRKKRKGTRSRPDPDISTHGSTGFPRQLTDDQTVVRRVHNMVTRKRLSFCPSFSPSRPAGMEVPEESRASVEYCRVVSMVPLPQNLRKRDLASCMGFWKSSMEYGAGDEYIGGGSPVSLCPGCQRTIQYNKYFTPTPVSRNVSSEPDLGKRKTWPDLVKRWLRSEKGLVDDIADWTKEGRVNGLLREVSSGLPTTLTTGSTVCTSSPGK